MTDTANPSPTATAPLDAEVRGRFGVLPNFFRLAPETPEVTANLWGFARFGYLDLPLPPLFKERLFVYLSRFCEVRYCIARHVGFLAGLGRPAGDPACPPEPVEQVVRLIRRPLPRGDALAAHLARLAAAPLAGPPASDTPTEEAVFACATHVFLQTPQAGACLDALRTALGGTVVQRLLVFLTFVRTAHYWTRVHPELALEDDIKGLLAVHETLAECVLNDPEAATAEATQVLRDELTALRRERALREEAERANRALREADRKKDEFLAVLAHELRNPLAPLRNGLQVMKLAGGNAEAVEKSRTMMERQLEQMVRLVDDLLDVSRISRGKVELRRVRLDLADVLRQAVETSRPAVESGGHALTVTLPPEAVYVDADPMRLAQVVSNLLNNAAKFTDRGGRISLTAGRDGNAAVVAVADTGVGIPADKLAGVFEMFSQLDRTLEKTQGGLGIGLSLVKGVVELHGGSVTARSDGPGRGSEFVVRLPAVPTPAAVERDDATGPTVVPRRRILVVDDNVDGAGSLATMLDLMGNETRTAHDGLDAVAAAAAFRPDVILMDIGMPRLNGFDACRRIRAEEWGKDVVLVAQTGWGLEDDRRKSAEAGFDHHLVKPVDPTALMKLLAGLKPANA